MDGVEHILCTHCENTLESGTLGVCSGDYMAACVPLNIKFSGKTAHATLPDEGIDAIAMAHIAYARLIDAVKDIAGGERYIFSVGKISGGTAHNVIAELCEMDISFRYYNEGFAKKVKDATFDICESIARDFGGRVQIDWHVSTGPVHNDARLVEDFSKTVTSSNIPLATVKPKISSEDFGWYLTKARGMLFRFGTRNETLGCTTLAHCNDFKLDEQGMKPAIEAFISYVLNLK